MKIRSIVVLLIISFIYTSCGTGKMSASMANRYYDSISFKTPHVIQPDDKISVSIWNHDDMSIGSVYGVYNSNEVYGKWILVDAKGEVALPGIGKVKLAGYNVEEAADTLSRLYSSTIREPIILVKVLNKEVSVLGEVRKPGKYVMEKEQNSVLELLAKAEGFDYYADKKNVKLVRNIDGERKEYRLDFRNNNITYLSNTYLRPGDVLYVQSKKGKTLDKKAPTILPIASLITATILLLKFVGGN